MNAKQQQGALNAALAGARQMAGALDALVGGNGGAITVPALYLDFLPPGLREAPRDYFAYRLDFLPVPAAGGAAQDAFTVQSDSDFLIVSLAAEIHDPAAPGTAVGPDGLTIAILDAGSGRQFQNGPLGFGTIVGTGQLPGYLPYPKFIDRSSQVSATVTNNTLAQDVNIRLTFHGFKIFSSSQAGLR